MFKRCMYAVTIGSFILLAGCGGGGSDPSNNGPRPGGGDIAVQRVQGPLDPLQDQLSDAVFSPLGDTLAGTPLAGVIRCTDATVTYGTLDIADALLAALQSGAAAPTPDPARLTAALQTLAVSLQGLLEALAGDAQACLTGSLPASSLGSNPLAGTPLAPLGEQLAPILAQIAALGSGSSGTGGGGVQLNTLAQLFDQLHAALQLALAQIPAQAQAAPVVGGALDTLSTALDDTRSLVHAVIAYDSNATRTGLQHLLDHALVGLLTHVVPLRTIEEQAGQPGVISGRIESAAAQLATQVATVAGTVTAPVFAQLLAGALDPVLGPIENELLPTLLGALADALASGGLDDLSGIFAGTPLASVVNLVDSLLGTLLGGLPGGGTTCPFAGLPLLSLLCGQA